MRSTRLFRLRRIVWRARRSPPRLARPLSRVLPTPRAPVRPIFVLGCPRAGTSLLLQALLQSPALRSVQSEGHILWDEFHHPRDRGWDSDALDAGDVSSREREYVHYAVRLIVRDRRFVDKTPENCLRVSYLDELFPDARFVFLHRDAAENVSSLMEGWRARPRFVKYRLPEPLEGLGPLSGDRWSFTLVPGWRDLRRAPLEEICARQYIASNDGVLAAREAGDPDRWSEVRYEQLTGDPETTLRTLFERLEVPFGEEAARFAGELAGRVSATALSAPREGKWRDLNAEAVAAILPQVADTERRLGRGAPSQEPVVENDGP